MSSVSWRSAPRQCGAPGDAPRAPRPPRRPAAWCHRRRSRSRAVAHRRTVYIGGMHRPRPPDRPSTRSTARAASVPARRGSGDLERARKRLRKARSDEPRARAARAGRSRPGRVLKWIARRHRGLAAAVAGAVPDQRPARGRRVRRRRGRAVGRRQPAHGQHDAGDRLRPAHGRVDRQERRAPAARTRSCCSTRRFGSVPQALDPARRRGRDPGPRHPEDQRGLRARRPRADDRDRRAVPRQRARRSTTSSRSTSRTSPSSSTRSAASPSKTRARSAAARSTTSGRGFSFQGRARPERHQALGFARVRKNQCAPGEDDRDRAARQQEVLSGDPEPAVSPGTFVRLPWVSWSAPKTLRHRHGRPRLMALFADMATGDSGETEVLEADLPATTAPSRLSSATGPSRTRSASCSKGLVRAASSTRSRAGLLLRRDSLFEEDLRAPSTDEPPSESPSPGALASSCRSRCCRSPSP